MSGREVRTQPAHSHSKYKNKKRRKERKAGGWGGGERKEGREIEEEF